MTFLRALFSGSTTLAPERRHEARLRTRLRPGKLVGADGRFLADAAIIDRSETGARVRLFSNGVAPSASALFDESEDVLRPVRTVWTAGQDAGLAFSGEPQPMDEAERRRLAGPYYAVSD